MRPASRSKASSMPRRISSAAAPALEQLITKAGELDMDEVKATAAAPASA